MHRSLHILGWGFVTVCAALIATRPETEPAQPVTPTHATVDAPAPMPNDAAGWFARMKPFCNPVEVAVQQQQLRPPATVDGVGYSAACFALAGRIDIARQLIDSLPAGEQSRAAGIVFEVGHPVADAGDDQAASPIMELVVAYQPNNYMALYHAGISQYQLGHYDRARTWLAEFLRQYSPEDGWRSSARAALQHIDAGDRAPKPPVERLP